MTYFKAPPRGLLRMSLNIPAWLYRIGLGWLLGHRFLMLTHTGRRSRRRYQTVLEVAQYDPRTGASVVISAWGDRADWLRNIQAAPAIEIESTGRRYVPDQRFLSPNEVYVIMHAYLRHRRWARGIARRLFGLHFDGSDVHSEEAAMLRGVEFQPSARRSKPSLHD